MKDNNQLKQYKIIATIYCVAALAFYAAAIVCFIIKNSMGTMCLCLGSTFLCLEGVYLNKANELKGKNNNEKK